jgi:hypothetical protein
VRITDTRFSAVDAVAGVLAERSDELDIDGVGSSCGHLHVARSTGQAHRH